MSTGKGKKRIKNTPVLYDEIKKQRGINLTDTAWENLARQAKTENISVSELIERYARKLNQLDCP
jgi:predicted CopG family antitoxin